MKKLAIGIVFTLFVSFGSFAATDPIVAISSLQQEDFQLVQFIKGEKETGNECHFESANYELKIDYCTKSTRFNWVKKGTFIDKFTGEKIAIYIEDGNNRKKITNMTLFQAFQEGPSGINYAYRYGRAYFNSYGDDFSRDEWKLKLDGLKGSSEMQDFINLIFNLIETKS